MGIELGILAASALGSFGTASTAVGLAAGTGLLSNLLSSGQPGVQPLPSAPSDTSKEVQQAELAERDRIRRARGRSSTILTGDLGSAPTQVKTLLGGN